MRSKLLFASTCAVAALAVSSPAAASLSDFRLPTEPQQPPPDVQGPVAPDVPASRRRAATPTPSASADPAPEPAAPPVEVPPPELLAAPEATPARTGPTPAPSPAAAVAGPAVRLAEPPAASTAPSTSVSKRSEDLGSNAEPTTAPSAQGARWWLWLLGAAPLLVAVGWAARRVLRRRPARASAPPIVRPSPAGPAAPLPSDPLRVALEPRRLALTLMNATLAYRLELTNRGPRALSGLTVGADMISAHASISREEQLSGPRNDGEAPAHRIERLEPGESRVLEGEFRLPFPQIVPIRQGNASLLVPLARFRVEAEGAAPLVRTFAIGQPGPGDALQPFRLDQGPRIYPRLTQHAFA